MTHDVASYDEFWAAFFGVDAARLREPGVTVVRHALLGDYPGVWLFARESSVVVSAPDAWLERLGSRASRIRVESLASPLLHRELFDREPDRVIGPAYQGYLLRDAFRPVRSGDVRSLSASDHADLAALRSACTSEEWEHSGLSSASDPRFGCFVDGQLVAAAGTDRWTADAINPGVLTHPDHRGRGHGTAAVSSVVEDALASGLLALYQTLMANAGSVALAGRLGYRQYATHVAIRVQAS
jgi:GNAT superfamily N-acetyltransferase